MANEMQAGYVFVLWISTLILITIKNEHHTTWIYDLFSQYDFFCSDDKNLCSKALLSGVKALSKADLVKEVEENRRLILNFPRAPPVATTPVGPLEKGLLLIPAITLILFLHH